MSPVRMSKFESAMRLALAFNEAFNRRDVKAMMRQMSDDCVFESTSPAPDGRRFSGKDAVSQFWQEFFRTSPEAHIQIEEIFSVGERCIMHWKCSWTEADGSEGHMRGVDIYRVRDKLIREMSSYVKGNMM